MIADYNGLIPHSRLIGIDRGSLVCLCVVLLGLIVGIILCSRELISLKVSGNLRLLSWPHEVIYIEKSFIIGLKLICCIGSLGARLGNRLKEIHFINGGCEGSGLPAKKAG